MTPAVLPFLFDGATLIRAQERIGVPWFVAADVCRALGIQQPSRAVAPLDDDEKGVLSIHTPGGLQELLAVTEGGLFTLMLRSREATTPGTVAHRFRRWVTGEVLPALRRGSGGSPSRLPNLEAAELEGLKLRAVGEARKVFGQRAAGQLWFTLGLPTVPAMALEPCQGDMLPHGTAGGAP